MTRYSEVEERDFLLGDLGYRADLGDDFEAARAANGLGSSAHAFLTTSVRCFLVGLPEPAKELLKKAVSWLTVAIQENERPTHYFEHGTEALRFRTLSLCNWLLHGDHDNESLRSFVLHEDRFLGNSPSRNDALTVRLVLAAYVDAGACERVLELVGWINAKPASTRKAISEEEVSRVMCEARMARIPFGEARVVGERFIARNIETWLTRGHAVRLAEWAKIVYWDEGKREIPPEQTLLEALGLLGSGLKDKG